MMKFVILIRNQNNLITKQLPMSIETRLSKLSSNEKVFDESVSIYQETLDKSGYKYKLTFQKTRILLILGDWLNLEGTNSFNIAKVILKLRF